MCAESKKDIVKSAYNFTQEGKWDKAILEYKKLLTLDPTDFNIHNMLGDIYIKKKDDHNAYQEYLTAAEAYVKQGLAEKANLVYKKIAKLDTNKLNEPDRKKQLVIKTHTEAEKFLEEKAVDKAIETYLKLLKVNPDDFESYQKLGELYTMVGNKEEAIAYYSKIVEVYYKNRIFKKALPIYRKMSELRPDEISYREKMAEINEKENNESDAKRDYIFLAEYFWKQKNIEKTDFYSQKAIDFKSIEAHYFKGAAMYERKEYGEAKKEMEMLLKFKANHVGALFIMGEINKNSGQIDDAISTFTKIIKIEEDNTQAHEMIAELQMQKGLKKEATAKYMIVANIYIKKHDLAKAEEVLNNILKHDPENIEVLQKLGDLYASQDTKKNDAATVYIKIAEIYKKENMPDKESDYYKLAEEMNPAHQKLIDKAKKITTGTAPVQQPQPQSRPMAPQARVEQKKPEREIIIEPIAPVFSRPQPVTEPEPPKREPLPKFEPAVSQDDFFKPPAISSEEQLKKIEEIPETSFETFTSTKASVEDVPSLIAMADSYAAGGSFDEAIEMYQQAVALDPDNQEIRNKLNFVYSKYAGLPPVDTAGNKKKEDERKKKEEEIQRVKSEEEKIIREDQERRKKEELNRKKADEDRKKTEDEKRKAEEEKKKREKEEEQRKKAEEERKKKEKEEEEKRKKESEKSKQEAKEEQAEDEEIGSDFITVTTAEIFMKQGLLSEAEKILNKIVNKDMNNLEARMKLEELKKIKEQGEGPEEKQEDQSKKDDDGKKGKQSKVSYI